MVVNDGYDGNSPAGIDFGDSDWEIAVESVDCRWWWLLLLK